MFLIWDLQGTTLEHVFAGRGLYDTSLAQHVVSASILSRRSLYDTASAQHLLMVNIGSR